MMPPDHKVRRAFSVPFYEAACTCKQAQYSLFDSKVVLARSMAMPYAGGQEQFYIDLLERFKVTRLPDETSRKEVSR
jgi:hypothetical protein